MRKENIVSAVEEIEVIADELGFEFDDTVVDREGGSMLVGEFIKVDFIFRSNTLQSPTAKILRHFGLETGLFI